VHHKEKGGEPFERRLWTRARVRSFAAMDMPSEDQDRPDIARRLRQTALSLIGERGFDNFTVDDIAKAAGVPVATFYDYFQSKEASLFGMDPEEARAFRKLVVNTDPGSPAFEALRTVIANHAAMYMSTLGDNPIEWLQRVIAISGDPNVRASIAARVEMMLGAMREGVAERLGTDPRLDPYPALVAAVASAAYRVSMMHWTASGGKTPIREVVNLTFDALAAGLPEDCELRTLKGA
jgi:AcrR family transcriptional regulator